MNIEEVKACWLEVFPNGHITSRVILGSTSFTMYLQKPCQWANGISRNDSLHYAATLYRSGEWQESMNYLLVASSEKYSAYESVSIRKQNIKALSKDNLVKRFKKIRQVVLDNHSNIVQEVTL